MILPPHGRSAIFDATMSDRLALELAPAEKSGLESPADKVARLNSAFFERAPLEILEAAFRAEFPGRIALVSSFGTEAALCLALAAQIDKAIPVLFLDTGKHFAQTLDYRDQLIAHLGLTQVQSLRPERADLTAEDPKNDLWRRDGTRCCLVRKSWPLDRALIGYDAWVTGRKRVHGADRARLDPFEFVDGKFKVNPLFSILPEEIEALYQRMNLPPHPLAKEGYASVGCWPCTQPSAEGRGGRFGDGRTECGIHKPRPNQVYDNGL